MKIFDSNNPGDQLSQKAVRLLSDDKVFFKVKQQRSQI